MKKYLLIIYSFSSYFIYAQHDSSLLSNYEKYHETLNEIYSFDSIYNDSVINIYERAFKFAIPFSEDVYDLSYYYYSNDNKLKAEKCLEKSVLLGYQMKKDISYYDSLYPEVLYGNFAYGNSFVDTTSAYFQFESNFMRNSYDSLRAVFLGSIQNDSYFEVLLENEKYAQLIRLNQNHSFYTREVLNNEVFKPNANLIFKLIEVDMFPSRRSTRRFNSHSISMLLNHCIAGMEDKDQAEKLMKMLWQKVVLGELTPIEYASAYDHYVHHFINSRKSYFGTNLKKGRIRKLLLPKKIGELRNDYWLPSIENYANYYDLKLPKNLN